MVIKYVYIFNNFDQCWNILLNDTCHRNEISRAFNGAADCSRPTGAIWGRYQTRRLFRVVGLRYVTNLSPIDVAQALVSVRRQLSTINNTLFVAVRDAICSLFDDSYRGHCCYRYCLFCRDIGCTPSILLESAMKCILIAWGIIYLMFTLAFG